MTTSRTRGRLGAVAVAVALATMAVTPPASAGEAGRGGPLIVGGDVSAAGAWPAAVALAVAGQAPMRGTFCGGTVVHPRWVLTAAHCVQQWRPRALAVHTGEQSLRSAQMITDGVQRIERARWNPRRERNDLALLLLREPTVQPPMSLAQPRDYHSRGWATILGWGSTHHNGRGKSAVLREGRVRLLAGAQCVRQWQLVDPARQLCAGLTTFSRVVDSCFGDSGGPLVVMGPDGYPRLAGVASYGARRCGAPRQSAVYTKVAAYGKWIRRTVARFTPAEPPVTRPPTPELADPAPPVSAGLGEPSGPA